MDLQVISNNPKANVLFLELLKKHGLNGRVINRWIMSNPLLIYISETTDFQPALIRDFLGFCPGVYNLTKNPDRSALYLACFEFEGDSTSFELKSDSKTIVIGRSGTAGVKLCHLFQTFYPKLLHVIDEGYYFAL